MKARKISNEEFASIIERLKNDDDYYGDFGRQFMSSSDIKTLVENPAEFGKYEDDSLPPLKGAYLHTAILEPQKLDKYVIFDGASRNSAKYKEFTEENGMCLLKKEVVELEVLIDNIMSKDILKSLIKADGNEFEVPNIGIIQDYWFKGKADVLNHSKRFIIDIKTTADIERFNFSAREYYYGSQAHIYEKLFPGYEFIFIVVCKKRGTTKIFTCSDDFKLKGQLNIAKALKNHEKFYSEDSIEDASQHVDTIEL